MVGTSASLRGQVPPLNHPAPAPWRAPGTPERREEIETGASCCFSRCRVSAQRLHTLYPRIRGWDEPVRLTRPLQGAGEAVLPLGRLRSAEQRRMCIRVHVVLHPDGLISQHIIQSSGSSVMGREAWHAAGHGVAKSWTQLSD